MPGVGWRQQPGLVWTSKAIAQQPTWGSDQSSGAARRGWAGLSHAAGALSVKLG